MTDDENRAGLVQLASQKCGMAGGRANESGKAGLARGKVAD